MPEITHRQALRYITVLAVGTLLGIALASLWFGAAVIALNRTYDDFRESVAAGTCSCNSSDARASLGKVQFEFMTSLKPLLKFPWRSDVWLHFGQRGGSTSPCGWARKSSRGWYLKVD